MPFEKHVLLGEADDVSVSTVKVRIDRIPELVTSFRIFETWMN